MRESVGLDPMADDETDSDRVCGLLARVHIILSKDVWDWVFRLDSTNNEVMWWIESQSRNYTYIRSLLPFHSREAMG